MYGKKNIFGKFECYDVWNIIKPKKITEVHYNFRLPNYFLQYLSFIYRDEQNNSVTGYIVSGSDYPLWYAFYTYLYFYVLGMDKFYRSYTDYLKEFAHIAGYGQQLQKGNWISPFMV